MGVETTNITFYVPMPYECVCYCSYNGTSWTITNQTRVGGTYSQSAWNAGTGVLTISHPKFNNPMIGFGKVGGPNYASWQVREFASGYAYDSTTVRLETPSGTVYTPSNGDWFYFTRGGRYWDGTETGYTNNRTSPTNQFTNGFYMSPISVYDDWLDSDSGVGFNNFQFLLIGK